MSNDKRLEIIEILKNGETCACKFNDELNLAQSTVSHHMKILETANIVTSRKDGKWIYYSLNSKTFEEVSIYFNNFQIEKIFACSCKGE